MTPERLKEIRERMACGVCDEAPELFAYIETLGGMLRDANARYDDVTYRWTVAQTELARYRRLAAYVAHFADDEQMMLAARTLHYDMAGVAQRVLDGGEPSLADGWSYTSELEKAKALMLRLLEMFDDAAEHDDACVGYKSRTRLTNEVARFCGREDLVREPIPESWRE